MSRGRKVEQIGFLVLAGLVFLWAAWAARDFPDRARLFPQIVAGAAVLLVLAELAGPRRRPPQRRAAPAPAAGTTASGGGRPAAAPPRGGGGAPDAADTGDTATARPRSEPAEDVARLPGVREPVDS
jgi:hypothetical protein